MSNVKEFELIKTYENDMEEALDTKKTNYVLKVRDTNEIVTLSLTFNEWMERHWTDFGSVYLSITLDDGRKADWMDHIRERSNDVHGTWPMTSYACGVHADEVPERMILDRQAGVPTEYSNDGDPIFTSAGHRHKYLKVRKIHDRNGGYRS